MHHFGKIFQLLGAYSSRNPPGLGLWILLGDSHPSDPLTAHPGKKSCGRPCTLPYILQRRKAKNGQKEAG